VTVGGEPLGDGKAYATVSTGDQHRPGNERGTADGCLAGIPTLSRVSHAANLTCVDHS
jgi:hypothetical protein